MTTIEVVQEMLEAEFSLKQEQLKPATKLADLGLDSIATIEFLFVLEKRFKLDLSSEQVPIVTVGDIAVEIDRQLVRQAAGAATPGLPSAHTAADPA